MSAKVLNLKLSEPLAQSLSQCLRYYVEAAYPPGASDCAQVARATLLDAAQTIDSQVREQAGLIQVSRRLRSQLKAALEYCQIEQVCGISNNDVTEILVELQG